ncbi:MAG TPA: nucleoside-diphosphate kinase, partial [Candidatus Poseidoniales archaeon]|nr:nucleoside-diphosphate kinase [Candidatus Poseidoniales archaeon]
GKDAISVVRTLVGGTNPVEAKPGTIRGDLAIDVGRNVIHASDGPETAEYELGLWFPEGVVTWTQTRTNHIYE